MVASRIYLTVIVAKSVLSNVIGLVVLRQSVIYTYLRYMTQPHGMSREAKMPFKSKAQMREMFANQPKIAKRWAKETPNIKALPEKLKKKKAPKKKPSKKY